MPDLFANITEAPREALEMIAQVLELRASIPQQLEMVRTYLRDIDFPERAQVLEIGCGTGLITRLLADWPKVESVVGVDPSPFFIERARSLSSSVPQVVFDVGDGRSLAFQAASFDVVVLHTVLTHVPRPEALLAEAHRVLCSGGWLAVCDGDFSTATVATGESDPLEACVHAFVEGFVNDPWMVHRMQGLAENAGFTPSHFRTHRFVETTDALLTPTWVERGADVLASRGRITPELAAALKAEAKGRVEAGTFFGSMDYASMIGRKRR